MKPELIEKIIKAVKAESQYAERGLMLIFEDALRTALEGVEGESKTEIPEHLIGDPISYCEICNKYHSDKSNHICPDQP